MNLVVLFATSLNKLFHITYTPQNTIITELIQMNHFKFPRMLDPQS